MPVPLAPAEGPDRAYQVQGQPGPERGAGGKSNAMCRSKCIAPVPITATTVSSVPAQSDTVIFASDSTRRYSSTMLRMPTTVNTRESWAKAKSF